MISIIIPTYNEAEVICTTIRLVQEAGMDGVSEILVVDGGSSDQTLVLAEQCGAKAILSERKGRSAQMNKGALVAKGPLLYFLHADTIPPTNFTHHLVKAWKEGYSSGSVRLSFDHPHWFLKANCWFTRFDVNAIRFGDQSLFVDKEVFIRSGGFREDLYMMEDQEIIHRIKKWGRFKVMDAAVVTSARKYLDNGIYRMQGIFFRIWLLYYLGYPQEHLLRLHRKWIRKHKL